MISLSVSDLISGSCAFQVIAGPTVFDQGTRSKVSDALIHAANALQELAEIERAKENAA